MRQRRPGAQRGRERKQPRHARGPKRRRVRSPRRLEAGGRVLRAQPQSLPARSCHPRCSRRRRKPKRPHDACRRRSHAKRVQLGVGSRASPQLTQRDRDEATQVAGARTRRAGSRPLHPAGRAGRVFRRSVRWRPLEVTRRPARERAPCPRQQPQTRRKRTAGCSRGVALAAGSHAKSSNRRSRLRLRRSSCAAGRPPRCTARRTAQPAGDAQPLANRRRAMGSARAP